MERLETRLEGPAAAFFQESYCREKYADLGIPEGFMQDNHSRSGHGVMRGMHFQVGDGMEAPCGALAA